MMEQRVAADWDCDIWLRTGRRMARPPQDTETKFNPYHDPYNGRFTYAPGGEAGGDGGGEGRISNESSPFTFHARRSGVAGDVARKLNRLVTTADAKESIRLGGRNVVVSRSGRTSTISLKIGGGIFKAEGRYQIVRGVQALKISVLKYGLAFPFSLTAKIASFPSSITIYSDKKGN